MLAGTYLIKREPVRRQELELGHHRNRILSTRDLTIRRMQPIEGHERDSTAVFLIHDFEDPGGGSVIVNDNVEETGKGKLG
jgi:hypothetical protein